MITTFRGNFRAYACSSPQAFPPSPERPGNEAKQWVALYSHTQGIVKKGNRSKRGGGVEVSPMLRDVRHYSAASRLRTPQYSDFECRGHHRDSDGDILRLPNSKLC